MRSVSEWETKNPVLERGAIGVEAETFLYKIGDGELTWNELPYAGMKGVTKLSEPRQIRLIGDAEGSTYFDGSADVDIDVTIDGTLHKHNAEEIDGFKDRVTTIMGFYRFGGGLHVTDGMLQLDESVVITDEEREKIKNSVNYKHPQAGPSVAVTNPAIYKITVDTDGHVNTADKAVIDDLPDSNNYVKMTRTERAKLATVEMGAVHYEHPKHGLIPAMTYTELKKVMVDEYGHVRATSDPTLDDIQDAPLYVRMTLEERDKLNTIEYEANKYVLPEATTHSLGGVKLAAIADFDNPAAEDVGIKAITPEVLDEYAEKLVANLPKATTTSVGVVQLTSDLDSTEEEGYAVTPKAMKDLADIVAKIGRAMWQCDYTAEKAEIAEGDAITLAILDGYQVYYTPASYTLVVCADGVVLERDKDYTEGTDEECKVVTMKKRFPKGTVIHFIVHDIPKTPDSRELAELKTSIANIEAELNELRVLIGG